MNFLYKNISFLIFTLLLVGNLSIFVTSMRLSDDINRYDSKMQLLVQENSLLEKKLYEVQSLQYAASLSARLDFTVQSQPVYFENLKYALNR